MMDTLFQDVRHAFRMLRRSPGFTFVAVLTVALGIGANTAIYSVVDAVLLRPLPYPDPDRLVRVWEFDRTSGTTREGFSAPDYFDLRERTRVLGALAAYRTEPMSLAVEDAERVQVTRSTHDLFPILGATPVLGRVYGEAEDEPGAAGVAVLSEEFWRRRFGGDPGIVGRTIRLDGEPFAVVGVMPAGFAYPSAATDLWVPLRFGPTSAPRGVHNYQVVARLAPGATLETARRELADVAAELEAAYPADNRARGMAPEPLRAFLFGNVRPTLLVLLGAVGFVLLIACANVANLLLARGTARGREVAVRVALGATGGRLARQFAVETLVLAILGGGVGVAAAYWGLDLLLALVPGEVPRLETVAIDGRVLGVVAIVLLAVGLVFGLVPTLQARRLEVQRTLREEGGPGGSAGRGRQRLRAALVVAEIALAAVLVSGAALLVRSLWTLVRVDPGFRAENVVKLDFQLPASRYPQAFRNFPNYPEVRTFQAELVRRVAALPGVRSAALAVNQPVDPGWTTSFRIEGQSDEEAARLPEVSMRIVGPGYRRTVGVPLLRGRDLSERDNADAPLVTLVNEAFARRYLPGADPVGERVVVFGRPREIVGVIGDERFAGLGADVPPAVYPPITQIPLPGGSLLVRAAAAPTALVPAIRAEFRALDPQLAVYGIATLDAELAGTVAGPRFTATLLGLFAGLALALALVGIHGVLAYTVAQRTREIGIRVALGASRQEVVALVASQGMRLAVIGLAIGLAGALAATRAIAGMLFGVGPADPATFAAVALGIAATALIACWLPARRAARVDPMVALRAE